MDRDDLDVLGGESCSDDELAALALAADADVPVDRDAVSLWALMGLHDGAPLPAWYMPAPMQPRRLAGWRRVLVRGGVASVVASFVAINACGLCNTYGQLHL